MTDPEVLDPLVSELIAALVADMPELERFLDQYPVSTPEERRIAMRVLMNVRPAAPLPAELLAIQDQILAAEAANRQVIDVGGLPGTEVDDRLAVVRADIITLRADAIVNAGNTSLIGCTAPLHACVDNAIHSAAGLQLREECAAIMEKRGLPERTGTATVTAAYNLPAAHVIHTVGPIVTGRVEPEQRELLASCYRSCLEAASERGFTTIAFPSISTGVFGYPAQAAAHLAVETVLDTLPACPTIEKVAFCVFHPDDEDRFNKILAG